MALRAIVAGLLTAWLCACGPSLPPDAERLSEDVFIQPLGPRLWRHVSYRDFPSGPIASNGLIAAATEGALLIDTAWNDEQTRLLLDWAERELGTVRAVVVTHSHDDRMGGIAEAHRRGITSVGLAATSRRAQAGGKPALSRSFVGRLSLEEFGVPGEAFFPGPGHSPDNLVVWLEVPRTLFGTCLVRATASSLGSRTDARLEAWPAAIAALERRYPQARRVVPGHGEPGGKELLVHTRALAEAVASGDAP